VYFRAADIRDLDEPRLRAFLERKIPEGLHLDYKRALAAGSEQRRYREFLKDATAFANAQGGNLLIGVDQPGEGKSVDQQLVGIEEGDKLAAALEDVASAGVDPRIPGFQVHPVSLNNGRWVLAAHVPPSLARPHMVSHSGEFTFYIRHREQIKPMTTFEVRDTVISALSAEARVREAFSEREKYLRIDGSPDKPSLLLQAAPLVPLESRWHVFAKGVQDALWGHARRNRIEMHNLALSNGPRPTINGVIGIEHDGNETRYEIEVHRTGYVTVFFRYFWTTGFNQRQRYLLSDKNCEIFSAFAELLKELWAATGTDLPYVVSCVVLGAYNTCFAFGGRNVRIVGLYDRDVIRWPIIVRQVGQDFSDVANELCENLHHAYGVRK